MAVPSCRCLTIGDPHIKVGNERETTIMFASFIALAREMKPDIIVVMGDVLDTHDHISLKAFCRAIPFLKTLSEIAPLYTLIGNHDRPNNSDFMSDNHPFAALSEWKNTVVVNVTTYATINGIPMVFVPYVYPGRFIEAMEHKSARVIGGDLIPRWREAAVIFAHQEFRGAKMGIIRSVVGDEWSLSHPQVISGHIHEYQILQKNIIYVGTPIQHGFGEGTDKTVSFFVFGVKEKEDFTLGGIGDYSSSPAIPSPSPYPPTIPSPSPYPPTVPPSPYPPTVPSPSSPVIPSPSPYPHTVLSPSSSSHVVSPSPQAISIDVPAIHESKASIYGIVTHSRHSLNVPLKVKVILSPEEVEGFTPEPSREYKIIIRGTQTAVSLVKKGPKVRDWILSGIRVTMDIIGSGPLILTSLSESVDGSSRPMRSFIELFRSECERKSLLPLYSRLFGGSGRETISIPKIVF